LFNGYAGKEGRDVGMRGTLKRVGLNKSVNKGSVDKAERLWRLGFGVLVESWAIITSWDRGNSAVVSYSYGYLDLSIWLIHLYFNTELFMKHHG
jgi:hypothetical protein